MEDAHKKQYRPQNLSDGENYPPPRAFGWCAGTDTPTIPQWDTETRPGEVEGNFCKRNPNFEEWVLFRYTAQEFFIGIPLGRILTARRRNYE